MHAAGDIGFAAPFAGRRRVPGFFVAPLAAEYSFVGTSDAGSSLALDDADPRRARLVLGDALNAAAPADGDTTGCWTRFGTSWYRYFGDDLGGGACHAVGARDQAAAAVACASHGAYLARISSAEENAFIAGLRSANAWIGGSDAVKEGRWVDEDGNALGYAGWGSGQPDNWADDENCAGMYSSGG